MSVATGIPWCQHLATYYFYPLLLGCGFITIFTAYLAAINVCERSHGGKYIFLCFTHYYYDVSF